MHSLRCSGFLLGIALHDVHTKSGLELRTFLGACQWRAAASRCDHHPAWVRFRVPGRRHDPGRPFRRFAASTNAVAVVWGINKSIGCSWGTLRPGHGQCCCLWHLPLAGQIRALAWSWTKRCNPNPETNQVKPSAAPDRGAERLRIFFDDRATFRALGQTRAGRPNMQSATDNDYVGHVTFDRTTCALIDRWRRIQTVIPTRRAAAVMLVRKAVARDLGAG